MSADYCEQVQCAGGPIYTLALLEFKSQLLAVLSPDPGLRSKIFVCNLRSHGSLHLQLDHTYIRHSFGLPTCEASPFSRDV